MFVLVFGVLYLVVVNGLPSLSVDGARLCPAGRVG